MREARDRSAGNRQLLSATYTADGERITKSDPITGAHINSYGLHDTNRNTVYTPGVGFRAAGTDRFHHADRLGSTRTPTDGAGRVDTVKSKAAEDPQDPRMHTTAWIACFAARLNAHD